MDKKLKRPLVEFLDTVIICLTVNSLVLMCSAPYLIPAVIILFLAGNIMPSFSRRYFPGKRLRLCYHGAVTLKIFLRAAVASCAFHISLAFYLIPDRWQLWVWSAVLCICAEAVVFWNGMICVYTTSVQLGFHHRWVALVCGMIPVAHLIALSSVIKVSMDEVDFETQKDLLNQSRKDRCICATKYPVLLVHGVFFRDFRYLNYWGRIPGELTKNGARLYYGDHQSAASVEDCACELAQRVRKIVEETGCGKVNIIAHSKGGLDCRYACANLGMDKYTASLTTINTPHRGCEFADYLLGKIPEKTVSSIASAYNSVLRKLGDHDPDFIAAVTDLTAGRCGELNKSMPAPEGVFCQSVSSKLNKAANGKFPLNFTYPLVRYFDGANDGLVSVDSMRWGENSIFLTVNGKRGISHGDMIDLNRENIKGFDVREFYVSLVADLKNRGL